MDFENDMQGKFFSSWKYHKIYINP